jgi:hemoglobin
MPPTFVDLHEAAIEPLLVAFYDEVARDPLLAPYFASLDMRAHIPRIADFWSTIVFHSGRYAGNAFRPHLEMPGLTAAHFARWVATLERTVDARVAGPKAELMKSLGHRIAYSMQVRLGITPFEPYEAAELPGTTSLSRGRGA